MSVVGFFESLFKAPKSDQPKTKGKKAERKEGREGGERHWPQLTKTAV